MNVNEVNVRVNSLHESVTTINNELRNIGGLSSLMVLVGFALSIKMEHVIINL